MTVLNVLVQVWSSDSGTTASPPSELVMKGTQKWVTGDTMKTVLMDANGQVCTLLACCYTQLLVVKGFLSCMSIEQHSIIHTEPVV